MKKIKITETQYKTLINESFYDSNKLYNKQYIENITANAPKEIKNLVRSLTVVGCEDKQGNFTQCVRIPEVLFVYIKGKY